MFQSYCLKMDLFLMFFNLKVELNFYYQKKLLKYLYFININLKRLICISRNKISLKPDLCKFVYKMRFAYFACIDLFFIGDLFLLTCFLCLICLFCTYKNCTNTSYINDQKFT